MNAQPIARAGAPRALIVDHVAHVREWNQNPFVVSAASSTSDSTTHAPILTWSTVRSPEPAAKKLGLLGHVDDRQERQHPRPPAAKMVGLLG